MVISIDRLMVTAIGAVTNAMVVEIPLLLLLLAIVELIKIDSSDCNSTIKRVGIVVSYWIILPTELVFQIEI